MRIAPVVPTGVKRKWEWTIPMMLLVEEVHVFPEQEAGMGPPVPLHVLVPSFDVSVSLGYVAVTTPRG